MPISGDGILEAEFDPARAAVMLTVDGEKWPAAVTLVTVTRSVAGEATVPVRQVDQRQVVGGWFLGSDIEMPLDAQVTYEVTGWGPSGLVAASSVTVETSGAAWGLWLKAPGRGELTCCVVMQGDQGAGSSDTAGGVYQVLGGEAIPVWGGVAATSRVWSLRTYTSGQAAALGRLLSTQRVLLAQTGQPQDVPSGYYFVSQVQRSKPVNVRSDRTRATPAAAWWDWSVQVTRTGVPAGEGGVYTGVTYADVVQTYATYQDILDEVASYADLQRGV